MKLKEKFLITRRTRLLLLLLLLLFLVLIKKCESYILDVNVVDKDDIFIFLYKNEHLLATSYYNFKPSYFFSVNKGEIKINLKIDYKESQPVKRKRKNQELFTKTNKSSISLFTHFSIHKNDFQKNGGQEDDDKTDSNEYNIVTDNNGRLDMSTETSAVLGENELLPEINKIEKKSTLKKNKQKNSTNKKLQLKKSNNLFLVLITSNQWLNYIKLKNKLEPSLLNEDNYIFTSHFNSIKRYPLEQGTLQKTIKLHQKNRYMLFLINSGKLKITVRGSVVYYDENTKHLSRDFLFIPQVLLCIAFILAILTTFMVLCYLKYELKSDILMLLNNFFFLLSICFNYKNVEFIRDNGYMYVYYWVAASISKKIHEIIAFIIYLQVSLGNMYIRNSLSRVEIQFVICFSIISFYTGLYELFLGNFQAPRYILQTFAYLFIFIAINFTSTFLSARMSEENLSFHVAELYKKYDIYKKYRLLFFVIILKPIILVIYKVLCLSPSSIDLYSSHEYFYVFLDIFFDVILYFILFLLFRPAKPIKLLKHVLSNEDFHID